MFQILVVEDDNELRDLFCAVLTENGYTAVPAVDGIDAFDILDETYVDLIISDIMMPRMDGFELIKALREAHYNTPVLMITARSSAADKREGFRIGTDGMASGGPAAPIPNRQSAQDKAGRYNS